MLTDIFAKITNPSGSITGILLVIAGFMEKVLGCTAPAANPLEAVCAAPWLASIFAPQYLVYLAMFFGLITLVGKFVRPGTMGTSLFGGTAVIVSPDQTRPGTVTPAQVATK